jgi:hypothetical protein
MTGFFYEYLPHQTIHQTNSNMKQLYPLSTTLFLCFLVNIVPSGAQCPVTVDAGEDVYMCAPRIIQTDGAIEGNYLSWAWSPMTPGLKGLVAPLPVSNTIKYYLKATGVDPSKNLIQNPDFEQGNAGFASTLIYSPGDLVPTETYDVLPDPQSANVNLEACSDHTSGSGNMLAVHLATQSGGVEIWKQSVPVTPSTTHHFYFWMAAANNVGPSGIAFRINGNQVLTAFPAVATPCTWVVYKGTWNSGNNTTADLTLSVSIPVDQAAIVFDDFYFGPVCEAIDSVTYFVTPPQAVATPAISTIPCSGAELTLSGEGSSVGQQFTYHWATDDGQIVSGQNTLHPVVNAPGDYTLTVDLPQAIEGECFKTAVVRVNEAQPPLTAGVYSLQNLTCISNSIVLNSQYNQPAGELSFQWATGSGGHIVSGANSPNVIVNQPGEYTLLLTNTATGCTAVASYVVNPPVAPTAGIQPPPLLYPNDTISLSATVQPANGIVQWSTPDGNIAGGANTLTPKITAAGTYILTVTNPATGCTGTTSTFVQAVQYCPVAVYAGEDVFLCTPGPVTLQGSVAGPAHDLFWQPEAGVSNPGIPSTSVSVSQTTDFVLTTRAFDPALNLVNNAGFENGNTGFQSNLTSGSIQQSRRYSVLENPGIANPLAFPACSDHSPGNNLMLASSRTDTSAYLNRWCQTISVAPGTEYIFQGWALHLAGSGQITFSANGAGFGNFAVPQDSCIWNPFTGVWLNGAQTSATICIGSDDPDLAFALDDLFFSPLCTVRDTVRVVVDDTPTVAVASAPDVLTCLAETVTLLADGSDGSPALAYQWSTPNGSILSGADSPSPVANAPGTYVLQVTDPANGCTAVAETTVAQDIAAPDIAVAPAQTLTCSLDTQILQGQNNSPAGNFSYQWTAANGGQIAAGETTLQPEITAPGTYTLLAGNTENGCTAVAEVVVTQDIAAPDIAVSPAPPLTCTLISQILQGQNAAPAGSFSYQWTPANGGQINAGETTLQPEITAPGTYTLLATNTANGCTAVAETFVTQDIAAPDIAVAPAPPLTCNLTAQTLQGQNNDPAGSFSYQWTPANGGQINAGETTLQPEIAAPGTYILLATNTANGCTTLVETTVTQDIAAPDITVAPAQPLTCKLTHQILQGQNDSPAGSFSYHWTAADGGHIAAGETSLQPKVDAPGTYTLLATNTENGCTAVFEITVILNSDISLALSNQADASCFGASDGALEISATGGNGAYTFAWSNGADTPIANNLPADTYYLVVTDGAGCTAVVTAEVNQPDPVQPNATATTPSVPGGSDGSAAALPTGGVPPYTFVWTGGSTEPVLPGLSAGDYTVTVTDANGCTAEQTITVPDVACSMAAGVSSTDPLCYGAADGSASASPLGGTGPFSYVWDNGATGPTASGLTAGTYSVVVTDVNGCQSTTTASLDNPPPLILESGTVIDASCPAASDGSAAVLPGGGTGGVFIVWSTGQTGHLATGLPTGIHTATATDANGCTAQASATVQASDTEPPAILGGPATLLLGPAGSVGLTLQNLGIAATDNCELAGVEIEPVQFDCQQLGPQTVTITATDVAGNTAVLSISVTVADQEPPVVECPQNMRNCHDERLVEYLAPVATDNCLMLGGHFDLVQGLASGSEFPTGKTVTTWTFTDAGGNIGSCSFSVTVLTPITVKLDAILDDLAAQKIGSILVSVSGSQPGYTFAWQRNGQPFATTEDLIGIALGEYTLLVTDAEGCTTMAGPFVVDDLVDTNTPDWAEQVRVYPNPTSGQVFVVLPEVVTQHAVRFTVLDAAGQRVLEQQIQGNKLVELDRRQLAEGHYVLMVQTQYGQAAYRLVVVR